MQVYAFRSMTSDDLRQELMDVDDGQLNVVGLSMRRAMVCLDVFGGV